MKTLISIAVAAALLGSADTESGASTNLVVDVRAALDALRRNCSPLDMEEGNLMSGFELRFSQAYLPVVNLMSNNWQQVIPSLELYATNRSERLVLMNTGWWYGDSEYLGYLSALADKVISNQLAVAEFSSFFGTSWSSGKPVVSVFARRHDEASVSNLIDKIETFFPTSGYWQKVRTGAALQEYLDASDL